MISVPTAASGKRLDSVLYGWKSEGEQSPFDSKKNYFVIILWLILPGLSAIINIEIERGEQKNVRY
jgi:hypothetical protein